MMAGFDHELHPDNWKDAREYFPCVLFLILSDQ